MPRSKPTTSPDESLNEIEARLAGTLKLVAPPRDLTQRLHARVRMPEPRLLAERLSNWRFFFLAVGGTISAMLLFITVGRALFHIFGRRQL